MKTLGRSAVALVFAVSFCMLLGVALATPLRADTVADFYRGRTVKFVSGFSPSGEYNSQMRVLARHMGRHIPGQPQIVASSMPGAGSMILANHLYKIAETDGTFVGMFAMQVAVEPFLREFRQHSSIRSSSIGSAALSAITSIVRLRRRLMFPTLSKKCCERTRRKRRSGPARRPRRSTATPPSSKICWKQEFSWFPDMAACLPSSWRCNAVRSTASAD